MTTLELLPCPFCGQKPHTSHNADYALIFCECGIQGRKNRKLDSDENRLKTLADEWNTRKWPFIRDMPHDPEIVGELIVHEYS